MDRKQTREHLGILIVEPQQDQNSLGRVLTSLFFVTADPLLMKARHTAGKNKVPSTLVLANKSVEWLRQLLDHAQMMKCSAGIG